MAVTSLLFDTRDIEKGLNGLSERVGKQAVKRALVRTMGSVQVVMARETSSDMGLQVSYVKRQMRTTVNESAEAGTFIGQVSVSGKRLPLIEFKGRGTFPSRGRGTVSAAIGGTRKRYPGAFVTVLRSGHRGIFSRPGTSTRRSVGAWSKNLPIVELTGPSLPHVFAKKIPVGLARGQEQLVKNLEHEVSYALSQVAR